MKKHIVKYSLLTLSMFCCALNINAADIDELVIFGTSFFDVNPPNPTINPGGKLWFYYLADDLNIPEPVPSSLGGLDFTGVNETSTQALASVQNYLSTKPKINDEQLYIINNGRTDVGFYFATNGLPIPSSVPINAANNDISAAKDLHTAGAKYILLPNTLNLGLVPGATLNLNPTQIAALTQAGQLYNSQLLADASALDFDVILLDFYGLINDIVVDPSGFGFTNAILPSELVGGDPNTFLWWDFANYTGAGNKVQGDYAFSVLQGPACFAALGDTPVGMLKAQNANILQELAPMRSECQCRCGASIFISGDYAPLLEWNEHDVEYFNNAWSWNATAGLLYDFNCATIGVAYGYSKANGEWNHAKGDFHVRSNTASLFGSYYSPCWYVNAIGNYSWLDFSVDRKFSLGSKALDAKGDTKGHQWGAAVNGVYYVWNDNCWKTGPLLNIEYQHINVNGYTEKGALSANLHYNDLHRKSIITALGWEATIECCTALGHTIGNIFGAFNREWDDNNRDVHFHVASLPGAHSSIGIGSHRENFGSFGAAVSNTFDCGLDIVLSYNGWIGSHHLNNHVISLGVAFPLPF